MECVLIFRKDGRMVEASGLTRINVGQQGHKTIPFVGNN